MEIWEVIAKWTMDDGTPEYEEFHVRANEVAEAKAKAAEKLAAEYLPKGEIVSVHLYRGKWYCFGG